MTSTDMSGGSIANAKARIDATHQAVLTFVPRILDAYRRAEDAEKLGYTQSLAANIALGKELTEAKAATKGKFKWTDWRAEHIPQITQTKASLCIRLYKGRDRLLKPDRATEDGKRISDGVATLLAENKMSVRKAAALLVTRTRTGGSGGNKKKSNEAIATDWFKALAVDELLGWWQKLRGDDDLRGMIAAATKALAPAPTATPSSGAGVRRM